MPSAHTGQAARNDLATLGHEPLQQAHVAVRDGVDLLRAELADLLAPEELASARPATGSAGDVGRDRRRAGCRPGRRSDGTPCVLLSRLRTAGFVSHDISRSGTLCLPRSRPAGVSEHSASGVESKRRSAIRDASCDAAAIANLLEKIRPRATVSAVAFRPAAAEAGFFSSSISAAPASAPGASVPARSAARCASPWCRGSP